MKHGNYFSISPLALPRNRKHVRRPERTAGACHSSEVEETSPERREVGRVAEQKEVLLGPRPEW